MEQNKRLKFESEKTSSGVICLKYLRLFMHRNAFCGDHVHYIKQVSRINKDKKEKSVQT